MSSRKNDPLSANDQPGLYESAETVVVEIEEETVNETNPPAEQNDEPAIEDVSPDPVALLQEIQQLQAEKNELRDRALRAQAELDNFRKRSRQQQMEQLQYANERLIADLLSVIDNFERALKSGGENGDIGS
ncbi:MAG: nucleotide exchange factor GrpE, partial [Armatimonadetes bacterium CG_4_10_14_3_um_filter_59_10]